MKLARYYVRVQPEDHANFVAYMERNNIEGGMISVDMGTGTRNGSIMMSLCMNEEEASAMRLSFDLVGFLNFNRALDRQVARQAAKITQTTPDPS